MTETEEERRPAQMAEGLEIRKVPVIIRVRGEGRKLKLVRYAFPERLGQLPPASCTEARIWFQDHFREETRQTDGRKPWTQTM